MVGKLKNFTIFATPATLALLPMIWPAVDVSTMQSFALLLPPIFASKVVTSVYTPPELTMMLCANTLPDT